MPDIGQLADIMRRLRAPDGCPWDRVQDFASIAPYTIEEAYEVADAIQRQDMPALCDELGDLLLQVVYHSQMAAEAGDFTLDDVISGICAKMIRRHPHVFGDGKDTPGWETLKAEERAAQQSHGALDGVALSLPALMRAQKLQKRAARVGFDWDNIADVRAKLDEELGELEAATNEQNMTEEAGDVLFSLVNLLRHKGVDSETALRAANAKFTRRFEYVERQAGAALPEMSLDAMEALWQAAKRNERA